MIEYIIIAILQGLVEWLPISSSGQVIIVATNFLNISPNEAFSLSIWLHFGTMLAVLLKFRRDYFNIIKSFFPKRFESDEIDIKKRNWLIIATIGTGITAIPLYFMFKFLFIEGFSAKGGDILTMVISGLLIITGIVLIKFKASYGNKDIESISKEVLRKDSLISGLVQGVSILPGISRSGITVSSMLFERYQQEKALILSFIMSVPVIIASIGVDILFGEGSVFGILDPITIIITTGVSFIVGYLTMNILLKIANRIGFGYFCIIYGLVALAIILPITIF
ncbi:MAG: undecaprenyl-diphosphate phosphatase [Promethearchaeota archaeon]|nr:MAG: undecaprenyl-diphosphate phosphatase [Candidatus Lokiarchaeota archaeon]